MNLRAAFAAGCLLLAAVSGAAAQERLPEELARFREIREQSLRDPSTTALPAGERLKFKGLEYFPYDRKYVVSARFEKTTEAQTFLLPTSVGTTRKFALAGILKFEIDGRALSLKAFRPENAGPEAALFVPFRDSTSGGETYSAGRYLEIRTPSDDATTIDFNFAYNPSCAYGDESFSCPLPPKDNFLQAGIRAGEKSYKPSAKP